MRDDNFTKENNAKHMWHPMGHPADSLANPPKVIVSAQNSSITDIDGHTAVDAVGGLWCGWPTNIQRNQKEILMGDPPICIEIQRKS